jgi:hypothetical protein
MPTMRVVTSCVAFGLASCVAIAGCAPNPAGTSTPSASTATTRSPITSTSSATEHSYFGADARQLVAMVPGCDRPTLLSPTAVASIAPALKDNADALAAAASASECVLRGYGVIVFRFTSTTNETINVDALARVDDYYAQGIGWSAAPTSTSTPAAERSVVQPAALILDGQVLTGHR